MVGVGGMVGKVGVAVGKGTVGGIIAAVLVTVGKIVVGVALL